MGLLGIALGLLLLLALAFRGWSVLLLAPAAALVAALFAGEPLLAHWTQTFMGGTAQFLAQFFPLFLLGALFGKLMDDSGSVTAIADYMTGRLGERRAILAVVLAGALVTYGGVSLFVAFFVLAPMAQALFRAAAIPRRLMPATIALGTSTFTMSALPGTPAIQNAIPMPFFGTTPFAAPGLGIIASIVMLGLGLWWLSRAEAWARRAGEPFGDGVPADMDKIIENQALRERATTAREFDPAELKHGLHGAAGRPRRTAPPCRRHHQSPDVARGASAHRCLVSCRGALERDVSLCRGWRLGRRHCARGGDRDCGGGQLVAPPSLRATMDAGANASVLPALNVASLVGFGAVVAAMPAFAVVREWVLGIGGGPLVSLAAATNVLAALTGSASGGLTIALDSLGGTYLALAAERGIDPSLLHRDAEAKELATKQMAHLASRKAAKKAAGTARTAVMKPKPAQSGPTETPEQLRDRVRAGLLRRRA
jgi:H+/gluconate symporter-like permease